MNSILKMAKLLGLNETTNLSFDLFNTSSIDRYENIPTLEMVVSNGSFIDPNSCPEVTQDQHKTLDEIRFWLGGKIHFFDKNTREVVKISKNPSVLKCTYFIPF